MNSIKNNITKDDIISEIKLLLGHDFERKAICIIVEGDDDLSFWGKFFSKNVEILESYSGKEGVFQIVEYFNENKRVIGICDKDYGETDKEDVYFYDFCNLEMMLISNREVFKSLICETYSKKENEMDIKESLLNALLPLSLLRKINADKAYGINFKGLIFDKIFSDRKIKLQEFIEEICKINKDKCKIILIEMNNINKSNRLFTEENILDITNGHDFTSAYVTFCKNKDKNFKLGSSIIERMLRCCFRYNDLIETNIYKDLLFYQQEFEIKLF